MSLKQLKLNILYKEKPTWNHLDYNKFGIL